MNDFKKSTWVSFTYVGKETKFITELFRHRCQHILRNK